jgi:dTDP-4-amino-4,6-dideoxygalactose transaminase
VAHEVLSLPMFPELTAEQIGTVAGLLKAGLPAGSTA